MFNLFTYTVYTLSKRVNKMEEVTSESIAVEILEELEWDEVSRGRWTHLDYCVFVDITPSGIYVVPNDINIGTAQYLTNNGEAPEYVVRRFFEDHLMQTGYQE